MAYNKEWSLSPKDKQMFIEAFTKELPALRAKIGISQDDLSRLIGVSRQTFGSIERGERPMSWSTYLALIMVFDYNEETHDMLRDISAFPEELITRFNYGRPVNNDISMASLFGASAEDIFSVLDEQALNTLKTTLLVEYARCSNLSDEAIIKTFSGIKFTNPTTDDKTKNVKKSIKAIKEKRRNNE